ncbi:MAG: FG-GAP-like repeat-containing protein [Candidatus Eisenbacteria bacterium]
MKKVFWIASRAAVALGYAAVTLGFAGIALGLAGIAARPASAEVLSDAYITVREGGADNALVGFSVGTAGDVNGDGYSDVLLNGSENNGTVWCYHGSATASFGPPSWSVNGGAQNWLGSQVSTAGDVNGDGYDDAAIGAPIYANGQTSEGAVYVYLGSPAGLAATPQIVLESNVANASFGGSVDTAGDVNGDGYDDIVVGAHRYANGQSSEGRAYLFYGSANGILSTPAWTFESNVADASLGLHVCGNGDVNGDGFADVLVAAPDLANGQSLEGRVYLFCGSANGLPAQADWTYESNVVGGRCGWGLGFAGDLNGDGYSDLAFDTGSNAPANGGVLVFFGGGNGPAAAPDRFFASNHGGFADNLYTAGDVNGDGFSDLVATEETLNNNTGAITILGGWESGSGLPVLDSRNGQQVGEQFGADARSAGDVNGDGYGDVIAGAPRNDNAHTDEGVVRLYLGGPSLPSGTASITRDGGQESALFGYSVAQGDWNGDGYSDLATGAPYWDGSFVDGGAVQIFYGSENGYPATADWIYLGTSQQGSFGYAVANAGDVDNDGYDELLVGEPFWSGGNLSVAGRAYLYQGSAAGLEPSASWIGTGESNGAYYGTSLAGAGDVNGDGYADVLVGAPMQNGVQGHGGKVYVYDGTAEGLSQQANWTQTTGTDFDELGRSVAGAGDVNGDGYSDIVIGAPGMGAIADEGYIFVLFGSPAGPEPGGWFIHGNQVNARFGSRVAAAGDVDGDGYSDIVHGAGDFDYNGMTDCGMAEVYLGDPGDWLNLCWGRVGEHASDRYGFSVAGGGDLNNDGYSDIVIGAPWSDGASPDGGGAYLYLGSGVGGTILDASWLRFDTDDWSNFAWSISIAGDVTGDGVSDAVFGQPYAGSPIGRVSCFYGQREVFPPSDNGTRRHPRQLRGNGSTPLALLGKSDVSGFVMRAVGRSAAGRSDVALEYQVAPSGSGWSGVSQILSTVDTGAPVPGDGSRVVVSTTIGGLIENTTYHWRARFRGGSPYFPTTPWWSVQGNGSTDADLRAGAGGSSTVDDSEGGAGDRGALRFSRVTPNPSRFETALFFSTAASGGDVHLTVHDVAGRRIATLFDGPAPSAGEHAVGWDLRDDAGRDVPAGVYLARLTQGASMTTTTKLIVNR